MAPPRFPRPFGAARALVALGLLVGAVAFGSAARAAAPARAFALPAIDEPVGTELRRTTLADTAGSWHGGQLTTSTGDTVTVYVSDTYTDADTTPQYWAEFLAHLTHGPELASVTLYIAPFDEVTNLCGPQALGCYGDDQIVSIGTPYVDGTAPEEIVRHEYGHHVAANRSNPPWQAVDWGPKLWASAENVCSKVKQKLAYPGDESDHYQLNPGEAWAETYRLMDEQRAGITTGTWQIVAPLYYPDAAELQAAENDVLSPWTAPQTQSFRKVFGKRTAKVWTIPVSTPLDGSMTVAAVLPRNSTSQVVLTASNGSTVLARAVRSGTRSRRISTTICGQRTVDVRVTQKGALGAVSVVTSTP